MCPCSLINPRFAQARKGRANLCRKEQRPPAIATQPGCSHARTHMHRHALHGRLWLGASEALGICDFERSPFLNLYRIAHNKSTVDKWDNFPGEIQNCGIRPVLLRREAKIEPVFCCARGAPASFVTPKERSYYSRASTSPAASISVRANHWPRSVNPAEPYCRLVTTENMPSRERSATVTPEIFLPSSVPHQQPLSL